MTIPDSSIMGLVSHIDALDELWGAEGSPTSHMLEAVYVAVGRPMGRMPLDLAGADQDNDLDPGWMAASASPLVRMPGPLYNLYHTIHTAGVFSVAQATRIIGVLDDEGWGEIGSMQNALEYLVQQRLIVQIGLRPHDLTPVLNMRLVPLVPSLGILDPTIPLTNVSQPALAVACNPNQGEPAYPPSMDDHGNQLIVCSSVGFALWALSHSSRTIAEALRGIPKPPGADRQMQLLKLLRPWLLVMLSSRAAYLDRPENIAGH